MRQGSYWSRDTYYNEYNTCLKFFDFKSYIIIMNLKSIVLYHITKRKKMGEYGTARALIMANMATFLYK